MVKLGVPRCIGAALLLATFCLLPTSTALRAQQPQAQSGQPLYAVNAKYVNGVAPGYWPTAGTGLTLNLSAGTAFCGGKGVNYAGATLSLTASSTNSVYIQTTALGPPAGPALGSVAGGTLAATTYFVVITYVNPVGETNVSAESSLSVAANNLLTVTSPAANTNATGYNVYVSTTSGTETKQNTTAIAIGTNWTEPATGLIAGAAQPTTDTTACAPWFSTTGFVSGNPPIASVVTGATVITTITDLRNPFIPLVPYKVGVASTPVTVTNTITETALMGFNLQASDLGAGQALRIRARGVYSTDAVTAPTLTLRVRAGGVTGTILGTTGAFQTAAGVTNGEWQVDFDLIGTVAPATAAATECQGKAYFAPAAAGAAGSTVGMANAATVSWATNATQSIVITAAWSVAAATDTITQRQLVAERLN